MVEFIADIEIDRPVDEVFDFVANFENVPRWNYFVLDVTKVSPGPIGMGSVFRQIRTSDKQDYEITALQPGRVIEIRTLPESSPWFLIRYEFHGRGAASRMTSRWQLETGHNRLLERLGAPRIRAAVNENLAKLKELLETGATRLQDGRFSRSP